MIESWIANLKKFNCPIVVIMYSLWLILIFWLNEIISEEIENKFDHKNLNLDTVEFKDLNPSAENIAVVIWTILREKIDRKYELIVRLYETERNYVEYDGN